MTICKVIRTGNSKAVVLPPALLEAYNIDEGDFISISVTLVTKPKIKREVRK